MTIIEYSSVCVRGSNWRDKLNEAHRFIESAGFQFGVQIHNGSDLATTRRVIDWCPPDVKLSVHSPVLAKHFLNLATPDRAAIEATLQETLPVLDWAKTNLFFFHGFFLSEQPIDHDMRRYREVLGTAMPDDVSYNNSFMMHPRIFQTECFRHHKRLLTQNLTWLQNRLPHHVVALENDFPGLGTALQRPEDIIGTVPNLWLDLGHLWVASLLHKFDFYSAVDKLIEKVNIVGVHVNHNFSTSETPVEELGDSHAHLYLPSTQKLGGVMRKLHRANVPIITLEVVDGDLDDLKILTQWLYD